MKRLLSLLLICLILLSFSACGTKDEEVQNDNTIETEEKSEKEDSSQEDKENEEKKEADSEKEEKEKDSDEFSLNPAYISLVGKTKAEIDSALGNSSGYNKEFGMAMYKDDTVMYGFNTLGIANNADDIPSSNVADTAYISIEDMFYNCPSSLTPEEIEPLFPYSERGYDEMDQYEFLSVYYNSTVISFDIGSPLTSKSNGFLKIDPTVFYAPLENTGQKKPVTDKKEKSSEYYEYARAYHSNFKALNQVNESNENYYILADADHDGKDELVVKLGFGMAIYKDTPDGIKEIFYDNCELSGGSWGCTLALFNNKYYIMWYDGNYSQAKNLYLPSGGGAEKKYVTGVCYSIDDDGNIYPSIGNEEVSQSEFDSFYEKISECSFKNLESLK